MRTASFIGAIMLAATSAMAAHAQAGTGSRGPAQGAAPGQPLKPGFYREHASTCGEFDSGGGATFYFITTMESHDLLFALNNPFVLSQASIACSNGNFIDWNVTDPVAGGFNQVFSENTK